MSVIGTADSILKEHETKKDEIQDVLEAQLDLRRLTFSEWSKTISR